MGKEREMGVVRDVSGADLYHVISRGTGRQLIYEDDEDRLLFLELLDSARNRFHVEVYAYCLMGNHFHLLLHGPLEQIANFMKHLCGTYAQRFNEKAGRTGHLFQERYRSEPINDEEYLLTVVRYIHHNPTRAGLGEADKYLWSSYGEYVGQPKHCATLFVLELVGGAKGFASLHNEGDEDLWSCMDVDSPRAGVRAMKDEDLITYAKTVLGDTPLDVVKTLPRTSRDEKIRRLKASGFSIRQIVRLTGIGRSVISRA